MHWAYTQMLYSACLYTYIAITIIIMHACITTTKLYAYIKPWIPLILYSQLQLPRLVWYFAESGSITRAFSSSSSPSWHTCVGGKKRYASAEHNYGKRKLGSQKVYSVYCLPWVCSLCPWPLLASSKSERCLAWLLLLPSALFQHHRTSLHVQKQQKWHYHVGRIYV